ncbi:hypothetical protein [Methylobacterium persicinum]|uniref:Uncharacterized protein n=1 Tax=Methylobacterium persicinum TaxID=374426 RepID=A0ABU0HEP7_9HYPH|nr:hypothetical protein [Methylobacterium persicinum]MDQ0440792.1 hypothetical protein [Methylobacterium persicinum]GJE36689.1 hypothetical protein KHHGKMAE_0740 [Methylobacterium persicinum]
MSLRLVLAFAAVATATAGPALATPCADEVSTLERRLNSSGAAEVTGTTPPGGTTSSNSPKALATPPKLTPGDKDVKPTASGVDEAKKLVAQARDEDKAGNADACRQTIMKAKEKAGALP